MLNKIIYLPLILLLVIPMIFSYTPPNINSINITMCADYTPPNINSINITLDTENDCLIDSCTYSFGNWIINCEDNCTITTNVNGDGSNFSANGIGFFSIQANISGFKLYHFGEGCDARCSGGNCIKISEEEDETPPVITWEDPTPTDDDTINKTHVYLNTTITDDSNTSAWFDWNKTLKGYWAMDFYNSTGIYDNSTYNNFGVFHNMSITNKTDGKFGDAFNFSGSNYKSHMDMGNDSSLIFSDALTIDLWIKPAVGQETCYDVAYDWGNNGIIGSVDGADSTSTWSYQLRYGSPQNCSLGLQLNTVAGNKWVTLGYNLSTEDWSHIVATFDGTDEKIYVNGSLKNTTTFAATTLKTDPNNKIIVGVAGWGVSNTYYEGEIDEIKIHNRAISLEEVKASYNNGVYKLYNNFTGLSNGNYTYSAYAIDTSGNLNITTERKIKILSNCWTKTTWGYFNPTDCVFEMEIGVNYEN